MSDQLTARVIDVIAKTQHLPPESITIDKTFAELKIDSLDGMNILFAVESEFDIAKIYSLYRRNILFAGKR